jgi:hypothetical protein
VYPAIKERTLTLSTNIWSNSREQCAVEGRSRQGADAAMGRNNFRAGTMLHQDHPDMMIKDPPLTRAVVGPASLPPTRTRRR